MASRLIRRHKATVVVTEATLNQALTEARTLVNRIGREDPRTAEVQQIYHYLSGILRGGGNLTELFDDAVNPGKAIEIKEAVDRLRQIKEEVASPVEQLDTRPLAETMDTEPSGAYSDEPVEALQGLEQFTSSKHARGHLECPQCEASGFKNQQELDDHVDDKHKGRVASKKEKGAPMSSRLFARKKRVEAEDEMLDAAPEAVAGDAPAEPLPDEGADLMAEPGADAGAAGAAPAAPAPVSTPNASNSFAALPTEALIAIYEAITKIQDGETNPAILDAVQQVAEELKNRPMQPAAPEGAPKAAAVKIGKAPAGWEGTVKEMKKDKGIDNPFALAKWMKDEGYSSHKASFLLRRRGGAYWQAKFAAASQQAPPVNEDTLNKVDGQPHEVAEIGEAHGKREGVDSAEKHDSHPGAGVTTIKSPQDMEKQAAADSEVSKALKTAEQVEKKLGELYEDAKPVARANASAAVRDAVESIYDAKNKFAEAKKVLNRHEMQANAEEEAQDAALEKGKKKANQVLGLALATAE